MNNFFKEKKGLYWDLCAIVHNFRSYKLSWAAAWVYFSTQVYISAIFFLKKKKKTKKTMLYTHESLLGFYISKNKTPIYTANSKFRDTSTSQYQTPVHHRITLGYWHHWRPHFIGKEIDLGKLNDFLKVIQNNKWKSSEPIIRSSDQKSHLLYHQFHVIH